MPTPTADPTGRDTLRWFTRARRIPRLVGKLPGSERGIPGGPYTMTQAVGAVGVALLLLKTEPLWGRFGWISDKVIVLIATVGTAFLLRLVRSGGRDPLSALSALVSVTTTSRHGRLRGQQLRPRRPLQARARIRVISVAVPTAAASTRPSPAPIPAPNPMPSPLLGPALGRTASPPRPLPVPAGAPPRTNLERLLLQATEA